MKNYRFDTRSEEEFKKHIKECTEFEQILMRAYVKWLNDTKGGDQYTFENHGVDNSGEFIEEDKAVTAQPDFVLLKNGKSPRKIEIKHCKPARTRFHLKLNHVKHCIKANVCVVNWMATDTEDPKFCILTPAVLTEALASKTPVKMWNKNCLRFENKECEWHACRFR